MAERLDAYYGSENWRERIVPYIDSTGVLAKREMVEVDASHVRDPFGTVWRTDQLPRAVVEPGLKAQQIPAQYLKPWG